MTSYPDVTGCVFCAKLPVGEMLRRMLWYGSIEVCAEHAAGIEPRAGRVLYPNGPGKKAADLMAVGDDGLPLCSSPKSP